MGLRADDQGILGHVRGLLADPKMGLGARPGTPLIARYCWACTQPSRPDVPGTSR